MSDDIEREDDDSSQNANAEAAKYRRKARDAKARVTELEAELATLRSERDAARTEAETLRSNPSKEAARIAELEGLIRTRTHRDAFDEAAAGKIKPDALDAAWKLSDWKPETDEVDHESLAGTIDGLLAANSFLAVSDETTPAADAARPTANGSSRLSGPVPGLGRMPAEKTSKTPTPKVFRFG